MRTSCLALLGLLVILTFPPFVHGQCTIDWISGGGVAGTSLSVYSLFSDTAQEQDPELYVGGLFSIAGEHFVRRIAKFHKGRWWNIDANLSFSVSEVRAIIRHNDQIIAGSGASQSTQTIQSWNGSSWTNINYGLSGGIRALAVFGNELIAGGSFSNRGQVARFTGSDWIALGGGANGTVTALHIHNGDLYAGGSFSTAGGNPATRVARWDGSTWSAISTAGPNATVNALATYHGDLIVGGSFTSIGALPVNYIARWDGAEWHVLGQGLSEGGIGGAVTSLAVYDDQLYASGSFARADGNVVNHFARWDGRAWHQVGPTLANAQAMAVHDGGLIIAGGTPESLSLNTHARNIVRYDGTFSGLGPSSFSSIVTSFHRHEGELYASGVFRFIDQQVANGVARWDDMSQTWMSMNTPMPFGSARVGSFGDQLVAAGVVSSSPTAAELHVLLREGDFWTNVGTIKGASNAAVRALLTYQDDLICGGWFAEVDGIDAAIVARWNGASWAPMNNGLTGSLNAMCIYQGELIAAGSRVWRWDGAAWVLLGAAPSGSVASMAVHNNELYVGGTFTDPSPSAKSYVAKWNGSDWTYIGSNSFNGVSGIGFHRGRLYVGSRENFDYTIKPKVLRLDGSQWTQVAENFEASFNTFASHGRHLFVGGWFTGFNDTSSATRIVSPYWVRHGPSCRSGDFNCDGVVDGRDVARLAQGLVTANFSACEHMVGDFDGDDFTTLADVPGFVDCALAGFCQ